MAERKTPIVDTTPNDPRLSEAQSILEKARRSHGHETEAESFGHLHDVVERILAYLRGQAAE